jgi:hypothetical protein
LQDGKSNQAAHIPSGTTALNSDEAHMNGDKLTIDFCNPHQGFEGLQLSYYKLINPRQEYQQAETNFPADRSCFHPPPMC